MGSLEQVGYGFPKGNAADLKMPPAPSPQQPQEQRVEMRGDESHIGGIAPRRDQPGTSRVESRPDEPQTPNEDRGVPIGVHNGSPVHMRTSSRGEAEYSCGGTWSKSPPPTLSKSKIRMALETLHTMGIDTQSYEKSLTTYENYAAPVSLIAEDDFQHSLDLLVSLRDEKNNGAPKRRHHIQEAQGAPLFISNPSLENTYQGL
ncbi:MAG: hypothetical protein RDV48_17780 [Candidatus Eremiobacteraeota bacterium]|nr:hypothetical protein [Candidatus Eremiobacteraeota bacterium]